MLIAEPNERIVIADIKRSSLYLQGRKLFNSLYGNQTIPTFNIDRKIALRTPNSDNGEYEDNANTQQVTKPKETIVFVNKGGNNGVSGSNSSSNNKPVKNGFRKKILQLTTTHNQTHY